MTDPDSRSMATSGRGSGVVGYNVQVAVDTEHCDEVCIATLLYDCVISYSVTGRAASTRSTVQTNVTPLSDGASD